MLRLKFLGKIKIINVIIKRGERDKERFKIAVQILGIAERTLFKFENFDVSIRSAIETKRKHNIYKDKTCIHEILQIDIVYIYTSTKVVRIESKTGEKEARGQHNQFFFSICFVFFIKRRIRIFLVVLVLGCR